MRAVAELRKIDVSFVLVQSNGADRKTLKDLVETGLLKPHVSKTFPFAELAKAHEQIGSGRTVGKVIVTV
jgi:NADPH:quinone reductase-like Zn-dependent oxidoreductase